MAAVLEMQVRGCDHDNSFTSFEKRKPCLHPLNAELRIHACTGVDCKVESRKDSYTYSKCEKSVGVLSTIGYLKFFRDESNTTLSAGVLKFCPIHATVFNSRDAYRKELTKSRKTIIAYSPASFNANSPSEQAESGNFYI